MCHLFLKLSGFTQVPESLLDDRLQGDVGVRVVDTKSSSAGHQGINFPANLGGVSLQVPVEMENSYTNVLPSFNARYSLAEDKLLRFSIAKVMARQCGIASGGRNSTEWPRKVVVAV